MADWSTKKRETRQALHDAAVYLAHERGLTGFTLAEVSERAGVSARTFFNYFSSKEQAIVGLDPDELAAAVVDLEGRPPEEGPVTALAAVVIGPAETIDDRVGTHLLRQELLRRHPELIAAQIEVDQRVGTELAAALRRRLGRPDSDPYPVVAVAATMAALRAAAEWHRTTSQPPPLERVLQDVVDLLERTLGSHQGANR